MAISKKSDLSVPSGGAYRQFGYTNPNDTQKKSARTKKNDADAENNTPGAVSSVAGATKPGTSNISRTGVVNKANTVSAVNTGSVNSAEKVVQAYEDNQYNHQKIALEKDLDKLVKQLVPDLGVKFKVQDNGQITASVVNSNTKEIMREFPAEKMFDIIHSMSQKLGAVTKRKI